MRLLLLCLLLLVLLLPLMAATAAAIPLIDYLFDLAKGAVTAAKKCIGLVFILVFVGSLICFIYFVLKVITGARASAIGLAWWGLSTLWIILLVIYIIAATAEAPEPSNSAEVLIVGLAKGLKASIDDALATLNDVISSISGGGGGSSGA